MSNGADEVYGKPYNHLADMVEKASMEVGLGRNRNPPIRKIVEAQIVELELQIKERKELLASLDTNPGFEDVLNKMRKLHL